MKIHFFLVPPSIELQCAGRAPDKAGYFPKLTWRKNLGIFANRDIKFSSKRLAGRKCLILPSGFGLLYTELPERLTFDCIKDFLQPFSKQHIKGWFSLTIFITYHSIKWQIWDLRRHYICTFYNQLHHCLSGSQIPIKMITLSAISSIALWGS